MRIEDGKEIIIIIIICSPFNAAKKIFSSIINYTTKTPIPT
jgi:hypothetical protein